MESVTWQMIMLALLGIIIHIAMKVQQRTNKPTNKFRLKVWFGDRMNISRLVLTIASTAALLLMAEDIAAWFGVSVEGHGKLINVVSFAAGYFNHSLVKNILRTFKRQLKTPA